MKKFVAICLLLACLHARADVTLVEQVQTSEPGPQNQNVSLKVKGAKIRLDVVAGQMGQLSGILDTGSGDAIGLIHSMKSFVKLTGEKLKTLVEDGKKKHAADNVAADTEVPKIVDTGKQEKVGDYNTEIYTLETNKAKTTFWVSKEVPNYGAVQDAMKNVLALVEKLGLHKMPDISQIDGIAVKTETVANGKTLTITLVSVNQDPTADADFQVPADYVEMPQPNMGVGALPPTQPVRLQQPPPQPPAGGDSPEAPQQ